MSAEITAIRTAYEEENMSPEQIAEDRGLDTTAVKAALMNSSPAYRKACGKEAETSTNLNFSNDELERVNKVLVDLALGAEDDNIRLKAAMYIRDDKKGRKDVVKGVANQSVNVLMLNESLQRVKEIAGNIRQTLSLPSNQKAEINV